MGDIWFRQHLKNQKDVCDCYIEKGFPSLL